VPTSIGIAFLRFTDRVDFRGEKFDTRTPDWHIVGDADRIPGLSGEPSTCRLAAREANT